MEEDDVQCIKKCMPKIARVAHTSQHAPSLHSSRLRISVERQILFCRRIFLCAVPFPGIMSTPGCRPIESAAILKEFALAINHTSCSPCVHPQDHALTCDFDCKAPISDLFMTPDSRYVGAISDDGARCVIRACDDQRWMQAGIN
jgi:hypothetical protein